MEECIKQLEQRVADLEKKVAAGTTTVFEIKIDIAESFNLDATLQALSRQLGQRIRESNLATGYR